MGVAFVRVELIGSVRASSPAVIGARDRRWNMTTRTGCPNNANMRKVARNSEAWAWDLAICHAGLTHLAIAAEADLVGKMRRHFP
jgi:hypothetical protein